MVNIVGRRIAVYKSGSHSDHLMVVFPENVPPMQSSRRAPGRMALGAQRRQILRLVGRQGLWVVTAGLGIGMLLAFGVGELIQDFLVGIGPADTITYTTISLMLAAVAHGSLSCACPARRASRSYGGS
jgi:hypothetical protein